MGLSVVHGIVKGNGGEIRVQSEVGMGTRFDLFFPRTTDDGAPQEESASSLPRGHERILVVDDEAPLLDVAVNMLRGLGYEVVSRSNGVDAFEVATQDEQSYDLVITDLAMPQMTGLELAEKLLARTPGLPILLLTGYSVEITPEAACERGFRAMLRKPVSRGALAEAVRRVLDGEEVV